MTWLRRFFRDHRALAAGVLACALLMKMVVPGGYMIGSSAGSITIELCRGMRPVPAPAPMPAPGSAMAHGMAHHQDEPGDAGHEGREMPCAFAGLSAASLAATDPVLLADAVAFIHATVFRVATPSAARAPAFLRPPLRGPPASA